MTPSVSLVTTCKGRLSYLKQVVPTWLAQDYAGPIQIVVVDYGCPDETYIWAEEMGLKCIRVERDTEFFNMSRSRNIGAMHANGSILCFVDSHNMLEPNYVSSVVAALETADLVFPDPMSGSSSMHTSIFWLLRGFDEAMTLYGCEDGDFHNRFRHAGRVVGTVPLDLLSMLDHSVEEKVRFYPNKDLWSCIAINAAICQDVSRPINLEGFGQL